MKRKSERRKLMQQCDLLIRQRIFERDKYACVRCGATQNLQAAHILPKGKYQRLRFEEANILTMCLGCHLYWAHKDPLGFAEFIQDNYPGLPIRLRVLAAMAGKVDLKLLLQVLQAEAK